MEYSAAADWIKKSGICSQLHIHVLIWLFLLSSASGGAFQANENLRLYKHVVDVLHCIYLVSI